jgi:hypothetical protein
MNEKHKSTHHFSEVGEACQLGQAMYDSILEEAKHETARQQNWI